MSDAHEPELRERFAALRCEEQVAAPRFEGTRRRAERTAGARRSPAAADGRLGLRVAALLLACGWFAWRSWDRGRPEPTPPDAAAPPASILAWRPATDVWLRTPGHELIGTTPELGRMPTLYPLANAAGGPAASRRRS